MRPADQPLYNQLRQEILYFHNNIVPLPGITPARALDCLAKQIIDSIRRVKFVTTVCKKSQSNIYVAPSSGHFDPIKGACHYIQNGNIEEAFWLIFIATHFGKNKRTGWDLPAVVYQGHNNNWTWINTSTNFNNFRNWLNNNQTYLRSVGSFGNHRKYQSLDTYSAVGTGSAIGSYIDWVTAHLNHQQMIQNAIAIVGNDRFLLFDFLYKSMSDVISFGRTAKFDYLTMIGKLGLAPIEPGFTYLEGATGPKRGAHLLFDGSVKGGSSDQLLNNNILALAQHLQYFFCMQIIEDSLCNWQKSPQNYKYFGG